VTGPLDRLSEDRFTSSWRCGSLSTLVGSAGAAGAAGAASAKDAKAAPSMRAICCE
jgi:hypothetical protein